MTVVAIASFKPADGRLSALLDALETAAGDFRNESGCELYALHTGDGEVVAISKWISQESLDAHSSGDAVKRLRPALEGLLAGRTSVSRLKPHAASKDQKAAL